MSECSLFVKLLSGDLLTIPILSTDDLTIDFIIDGIRSRYEEYRSIHPNQFYLFPLEHDEKDICLESWKPEPNEMICLLMYVDEPLVNIDYLRSDRDGKSDDEWINWKLTIFSSSSKEETICQFEFFSKVIKKEDSDEQFFDERCVKYYRDNGYYRDIYLKSSDDYVEKGETIPRYSSIYNKETSEYVSMELGIFPKITDLIIHYNLGIYSRRESLVFHYLEKEWERAKMQMYQEEENYYKHYNSDYEN